MNNIITCKRGKIEGVFIHPTADVEDNTFVGNGTKIWRYCHVERYANIGRNVMLGQGVHVGNGVVIGDNTRIQDYTVIYRGVRIGDNCFIGPRVTFTNVLYPKIFRHSKFYDTIVSDNVTIGAGAIILCNITIGEGSFVGAGAVVTRDVPPNTLVVGNPARIVKKLDNNWSEFEGK
jgi:UDP-2-acetamido-3-amino-2,3-dideoxy-glucuronate N-acetyltransferase